MALGLVVMAACQSDDETIDEFQAGDRTGPPTVLPSPTGTPQTDSCPVAAPSGVALAPTLCPVKVTVAAGVASDLAASDAGVLVSVGGGKVVSRARPASGCPGAATTLAGINDASGPLAQGDDLWVAASKRVSVHDATGGELASCALGGATALAASGSSAWAAVGATVVPLTHTGDTCAVGTAWSPGGSVVTALGARVSGGVWVAVARVGCGTPVTLERRNAQGQLVDALEQRVNDLGRPLKDDGTVDQDVTSYVSPRLTASALGLCSVSSLAEDGASLWLGDRVCGRLVQVDSATGEVLGHWEASSGQTVLAVTARGGQAVVLTGAASGGERTFLVFAPSEK